MSLKKPEEETASSAANLNPEKSEEETSTPVSSENKMEAVKEEYEQLSRELNMDESTMDTAWKSYMAIRHNYTLEGTQLHWLACALYVACHSAHLPTVGKTDVTVEGNGVSLTRLLRSCKLGLPNFFNKAKKWADMSNMKTEFRKKIDRLERNFSVSNVIYKKYKNIYKDLFKDPTDDPPKLNRSRKQKKPPCTSSEVFDFCWTLFVRVKADYSAISDDLVNSYHLLLSCVDHIYANVILGNRNDLLKEDGGVHKTTSSPTDPPCILDWLSSRHDGIIGEVKSIREHWWRPHIKKFFDRKLLKGTPDTLSGLLESTQFEMNAKAIRKDYEAFVLSIGEFDERVFLDVMATSEIGTPSKSGPDHGEFGEKITARRNLGPQFDHTFLIPNTPLSGKHYLRAREQLKVTPVSQATLLVSRLTRLLGNREPGPSPNLAELFKSYQVDPTEAIAKRVQDLSDIFCSQYTTASDTHPGSHETFAKKRLRMGEILYYKLLETILVSEKAKGKPHDNLLSQDLFHQALFTCCLEIVIFSYNSQRTFPWVLDTFKLEAVHFYKVIEVIIRAEDWLPRDVVKHLQRIEEQILESRAWTKDSPLWDAIEKDPLGVPSCEEVSLPHPPGSGLSNADHNLDVTQSPLSHHERAFSVMRSPVVADRFKSPVVTAVARRQLSFDNGPPTSPLRAGQSLLASPQRTMSAQRITLMPPSQNSDSDSGASRRRTGSLALFFRKVYHLAHLRLDLLCHTLEIAEEDVKRKIWTVFEHTIRSHTLLMKDRHLDQLLMCSLYIVCKVVGKNINFTDIMKHYRNQPQAASHVYRSVLLHPKGSAENQNDEKSEENTQPIKKSPPPTPTRPAATSTVVDGEERGDLILFYNLIFMDKLQAFALRFKRSKVTTDAPPLSPLPKLRAHPQSPCRKISDLHKVFIRPLKPTPGDVVIYNPQSPHKPLSYSFSRSPAKDLAAINALMRIEVERKSSVGKRLLADDVTNQDLSTGPPPAKFQIVVNTGSSKVNTKLGLILPNHGPSE